jgi:hypothetical protein
MYIRMYVTRINLFLMLVSDLPFRTQIYRVGFVWKWQWFSRRRRTIVGLGIVRAVALRGISPTHLCPSIRGHGSHAAVAFRFPTRISIYIYSDAHGIYSLITHLQLLEMPLIKFGSTFSPERTTSRPYYAVSSSSSRPPRLQFFATFVATCRTPIFTTATDQLTVASIASSQHKRQVK